jgi:2-dehydro-3-deoxyphosphogluconate aldolase/(4S)-4-hydroxy-2-oxoglutarate aldolase
VTGGDGERRAHLLADPLGVLARYRLVPVVEIPDVATAVPLGRALVAGGLPCIEVTFRTAAAADAIRAMRSDVPDLVVGAGTMLTAANVDAASAAGAAFLVAPGSTIAVMARAEEVGLPLIPGVATPTEIEAAIARGLGVLKLFPAEASGGAAFLRAVRPVYPGVRFMPTGGIGPANVGAYLALDNVLAVGGSWMAPRDAIVAGDVATITRLVAEAVALVGHATPAPAASG